METYVWLATAAFAIWIYEQTRRAMSRRAASRERRLRAALESLGMAAAALDEALAVPGSAPSAALQSRLRERLLLCQGMQGFASELDGQLALYLHEGGSTRLPLLHEALHRELERTRHELGVLLEMEERPSWGGGFLRLLKPALVPALLAAAGAAGWQFAREPEIDGSSWLPLCRLLSWLLAALLAARLLEPGYRAERPVLRRVVPLLAAAPALLNLPLNAEAAPWLLAAQFVLAAFGFRALRHVDAKRRERPYAGLSPQLHPAEAVPQLPSSAKWSAEEEYTAPLGPRGTSSQEAASTSASSETKTVFAPR
ncbi:hypothetical protein [Saccharibacillus kuerlensis]|uniref:Uncharacterized protein n=1 Tax=Saccharibacillus kuerlensis TaxID=459527 RepID=A0ABQ2L1T2_9BACL|nr:hypothetical protein [Saccharibacillus kuerlensis]GGN99834.1 hypothetical protein GCM10010969_20350 [Saccharibacillus kuerlensis]